MNKVTSIITYAAFAVVTTLFVGCELDSIVSSSSSGGDKFNFEETRYVKSRSEPAPDQARDGAVSILRCGDLTIIVMEYTFIQRARGSCSGLDNDTRVEIGDLVDVYFTDDQVDWASGEVRPNRITAYAKECVPVWKPDFVCEPCE